MAMDTNIKLQHRLHFKIASFVIVTILIIFGIYSVYQFWFSQAKFIEMEKESTRLLGQALTSSLEIAMVNSDLKGIQRSLEKISRNQNIVRVFLLNRNNEIRASSEKELLGTVRSIDEEGCHNCHAGRSREHLTTTVALNNEQILRAVVPIKNKPACFGCHDKGQKLNGLLVLDRTLQPIRAEFYSSIKRAALVATLSILVMMLLFRWYIRKQVISRVAYLESLARRVVNNELDLDIKLSGTDELASLARSFNNMKGSLRLSIQEIERHRNYLTNLLNNLIDAILIIDDSNKVVFANKSLTTVLGPVFQSCQPGDKVDQLLQLSDQLTPIKKLIQQVRQQKEAAKGVVRLQLKSGTEKYLEVHVGHLVLPPQRKPEIIIVFRDITTVISFEKQMYQSEKLATLGRLAAGLAHEINNPMASILTCAEGLLKSGPNGSAEQREYLQIIKNSAQRCKMITQKLLDFSAGSNLRKELVDPLEVVKEAVSLLQFEASKRKVTVSIHCEKSIPTISGSRDALVQVFVNLILNSLQAIDDRGKVDIVMQADKSSVDITVKDNGIGISQDNLNHIFEPFFTTKTAGTGLGLSVSQGIIKQHHGQITIVESRPGRTSIKVTIPIAMSSQVSQV